MSFGSPKKVKPPKLPEPVATPTMITQRAGGAERRRKKGRRGLFGTILAGGRGMGAAPVAQAGLLTKFGGR